MFARSLVSLQHIMIKKGFLYSRLRSSQLLVALMAVGSSSCSSLPAQNLELDREMEICIHEMQRFLLGST